MESPELGRRSPGPYQGSDQQRRVHERLNKPKTTKTESKNRFICFGRSASGTDGESLLDSDCFDNCSACCGIAGRKISAGLNKARLNLGIFFCWLGKKICFCSPDAKLYLGDKKKAFRTELDDVIAEEKRQHTLDLAEAEKRRGNLVGYAGRIAKAEVSEVGQGAKREARGVWNGFKRFFNIKG